MEVEGPVDHGGKETSNVEEEIVEEYAEEFEADGEGVVAHAHQSEVDQEQNAQHSQIPESIGAEASHRPDPSLKHEQLMAFLNQEGTSQKHKDGAEGPAETQGSLSQGRRVSFDEQDDDEPSRTAAEPTSGSNTCNVPAVHTPGPNSAHNHNAGHTPGVIFRSRAAARTSDRADGSQDQIGKKKVDLVGDGEGKEGNGTERTDVSHVSSPLVVEDDDAAGDQSWDEELAKVDVDAFHKLHPHKNERPSAHPYPGREHKQAAPLPAAPQHEQPGSEKKRLAAISAATKTQHRRMRDLGTRVTSSHTLQSPERETAGGSATSKVKKKKVKNKSSAHGVRKSQDDQLRTLREELRDDLKKDIRNTEKSELAWLKWTAESRLWESWQEAARHRHSTKCAVHEVLQERVPYTPPPPSREARHRASVMAQRDASTRQFKQIVVLPTNRPASPNPARGVTPIQNFRDEMQELRSRMVSPYLRVDSPYLRGDSPSFIDHLRRVVSPALHRSTNALDSGPVGRWDSDVHYWDQTRIRVGMRKEGSIDGRQVDGVFEVMRKEGSIHGRLVDGVFEVDSSSYDGLVASPGYVEKMRSLRLSMPGQPQVLPSSMLSSDAFIDASRKPQRAGAPRIEPIGTPNSEQRPKSGLGVVSEAAMNQERPASSAGMRSDVYVSSPERPRRGSTASNRSSASCKATTPRIFECLRKSKLFGPLLGGRVLIGRSSVPIQDVKGDGPGSATLTIASPGGDPLFGFRGEQSNVSLSWAVKEGNVLSVRVDRATGLPVVDRFSGCDSVVHAILGAFQQCTHVVKGSLNPRFDCTLELPWPPSEETTCLQVDVYSVDSNEVIQKVVNEAEMLQVDPGTLLLRQGEVPDQLLVLMRGTIGTYVRKGKGHEGQRETFKISEPGVCMGSSGVLLGVPMAVSLAAVTETTIMCIPADALRAAMQEEVTLVDRLAVSLAAEAEGGDDKSGLTVRISVLSAHSLPGHVDLRFRQCDPTVFIELEGQHAHTSSIRYVREAGQEPIWDENFLFEGVPGVEGRVAVTLCEVGVRGGVVGAPIGRAYLHLHSLLEQRRFAGELPLSAEGSPPMHRSQSAGVGEGAEVKGAAGGDGGVLKLDVKVEGMYYAGEQDYLGALRRMGMERFIVALKQGGFRTLADLYQRQLDELMLAERCPGMPAVQHRLFLDRLESCRANGFLSKEADHASNVIRSRFQLNADTAKRAMNQWMA